MSDERWHLGFTVHGFPVPQGSMTPMKTPRGARVLAQNARTLDAWRTRVKVQAAAALTEAGLSTLFDHPVSVTITFWIHKADRIPRGHLVLPVRPPDIDKLARAVLDALTGVAYSDDGCVADLFARKRYAVDCPNGAYVYVEDLSHLELQRS